MFITYITQISPFTYFQGQTIKLDTGVSRELCENNFMYDPVNFQEAKETPILPNTFFFPNYCISVQLGAILSNLKNSLTLFKSHKRSAKCSREQSQCYT